MDHRFGSEPITSPLTDEELEGVNAVNQGLANTLGIVITYVSRDHTEGYVDVTPEHHQITGIANGGLYCSIGETLGSIAAVANSGAAAVGMSNYTDLLGSVKEGVSTPSRCPCTSAGRLTCGAWRCTTRPSSWPPRTSS